MGTLQSQGVDLTVCQVPCSWAGQGGAGAKRWIGLQKTACCMEQALAQLAFNDKATLNSRLKELGFKGLKERRKLEQGLKSMPTMPTASTVAVPINGDGWDW